MSGRSTPATAAAPRVPYDENGNNGLIIATTSEHHQPISKELLSEIFKHVDHRSLLSCQLVCKRWKTLIQSSHEVSAPWRKKAEMAVGRALPIDEEAPWTMYYLICEKRLFYRNLLKNHSGEADFLNWRILSDNDSWTVECPPRGVPDLPKDPVFDGQPEDYCFVTAYSESWKEQVVDLLDEGCSEYLLDRLRPVIRVSEWFYCQQECPGYTCTIQLLGRASYRSLEHYSYYYHKDTRRNKGQNQWIKFEYTFKNYGKGLRRIKFCHGEEDNISWGTHFSSKMAGACITLEIP